ncbi:hypothetical protein KCU90_g140, partial [Aureobasidium melanogenum]
MLFSCCNYVLKIVNVAVGTRNSFQKEMLTTYIISRYKYLSARENPSNLPTFSIPLFVYYQLVSVITVAITSTHHLYQLTAHPSWASGFVASECTLKKRINHLKGGLFLAIVALFLPPLSVLKRTGCDHHLFINIVLTLFGWTPGILHAWYIILRFPDGRRAAELREDVRQGRAKVVYQGYGLPAIGAGTYYFPAHQETRYRYWRHGPAEIYVQYPDGRFYKYKDLCCWSKGECPGQAGQRIVVLQQQNPLKPHLLQQFQYHTKLQPERNLISDADANNENASVAEEPLTTLYIEGTEPEPVEAALETRLSEPIPDEEPNQDGELISLIESSHLSYSSTPYITEEARACGRLFIPIQIPYPAFQNLAMSLSMTTLVLLHRAVRLFIPSIVMLMATASTAWLSKKEFFPRLYP